MAKNPNSFCVGINQFYIFFILAGDGKEKGNWAPLCVDLFLPSRHNRCRLVCAPTASRSQLIRGPGPRHCPPFSPQGPASRPSGAPHPGKVFDFSGFRRSEGSGIFDADVDPGDSD